MLNEKSMSFNNTFKPKSEVSVYILVLIYLNQLTFNQQVSSHCRVIHISILNFWRKGLGAFKKRKNKKERN